MFCALRGAWDPRRIKHEIASKVHFVLALVFGFTMPSGVRVSTWCKNLFAKEHNNVAEIYQNSPLPGAGRLSGDGLFRAGRYRHRRGRAVHRPERNLRRSILAWRYAGGGRH